MLHANEVVSTDRLSEALWPSEIPPTAAKAIQVYVSTLRKALGSARDVLETRGSGYLLRVAPGELDLHEFERLLARAWGENAAARAATLREALALWRGAPLADFEYESFVLPEAARLGELRQLAIESRIEAELELGGGPELVAELQALVAARPLQERPRVLLMRSLYRAGRQSEALDVYRVGKKLLDEELGLDPGPELRELERAILRQDPALADTPAPEEALRSIVAVPESAAGLDLLLPLAEALARGPTRPRARSRADRRGGRAVGGDGGARRSPARPRGARRDGPCGRVLLVVPSRGRRPARCEAGRRPAPAFLARRPARTARCAPVFEQATSDLAVLVERGGALADGAIVVPFGAFEHDWAALEIGAWAAAALERPLRLIGAMDQGARGRDASRLLADASLIVQHTTGVVAEPLLGPPGREGVAALAEGAGLLVLGLSDRWRAEGLGETRRALVESPPAPTVLVRRGLRPSGIAPQATLTRFTWSIEGSRI